jgi:hypothetical protein
MKKTININPPAPNPNDQFRFKILQTCSRNFLTDPLPNDWYELTEIKQDDFLCDHAWRREASTLVHPLEYFSAQQLWQVIDDSADTFYALFLNHQQR